MRKIKVTGTKSALKKLSKITNSVIKTNDRNGALFVEVNCINDDIAQGADARADGNIVYFDVPQGEWGLLTQKDFVSVCSKQSR